MSGKFLLIGLDGTEGSLLRRWMAEGRLPALASLVDRAQWSRIHGPRSVGPASVWPSLMTGTQPRVHQFFSEFTWDPATMRTSRAGWKHFEPFWLEIGRRGRGTTVLDVPFSPGRTIGDNVEVTDWGAHDWLGGSTVVEPAHLKTAVRGCGIHPYLATAVDAGGPDDKHGLERVRARSIEGTRMRGELALRLLEEGKDDFFFVVFSELHRAGHYLWHTVDSTHEAHRAHDGLLRIAIETDRQIGRLIEAFPSDATVVVFSTKGMRNALGIPTLLDPLFVELGLAADPEIRSSSWRDRAGSLFSSVKRHLPRPIKTLYHRSVPRSISFRLAQPPMRTVFDWSRTRAFPLVADQHGSIRINLRGRERDGTVGREEYEPLLGELSEILMSLRSADGLRLVREVYQPAPDGVDHRLPDLVVEWHDEAGRAPLHLEDPPIESQPIGTKFTGQHTEEGFVIHREGSIPLVVPPVLDLVELHDAITA
ncbi:MAG TPA: alkaline phosphatase family protein, partial [Thermoanaerobaculia bacterium]|nr:alkaline phosphatase family protein [Thermoanaerobaculia bacterium]